MSIRDFHKDLYVVSGKDFFQQYSGVDEIEIPVGLSAVTEEIPENLTCNWSVYGWDALGEKFEHASGEFEIEAEPFSFVSQQPVKFEAPTRSAVMVFATTLKDGYGNTVQKNFVPFEVRGEIMSEDIVLTQSPDEFTRADWSVKHHAPQEGRKIWGMGSGYFEYRFQLPQAVNIGKIEGIEFRAELASRYLQPKYLEEGDAERIGMTVVSEKGTLPGYGKNSYPQTDEKLHGSLVKITANEEVINEVELPDDPADHRGILSWMNQEPGWEWGSDDRSKPWLLDEAGSYGYLVTASLDELMKQSVLESGEIVIRLHVDETSSNRGGLSVSGGRSGRDPMDLTLVLKKK